MNSQCSELSLAPCSGDVGDFSGISSRHFHRNTLPVLVPAANTPMKQRGREREGEEREGRRGGEQRAVEEGKKNTHNARVVTISLDSFLTAVCVERDTSDHFLHLKPREFLSVQNKVLTVFKVPEPDEILIGTRRYNLVSHADNGLHLIPPTQLGSLERNEENADLYNPLQCFASW